MALDDSKTALGLGGVTNTITNITADISKMATAVENTLLPKVNAVARAFKGIQNSFGANSTGRTGDSSTQVAYSPKTNVPAVVGAGVGNNGNNNTKVASSPASGNNFGASAGILGAAAIGGLAGAMPSVPTAVMQDYLTGRSSFYGFGGQTSTGEVRSLQKQIANSGTALNSMDSTNAIIAAQAGGLGGVNNFKGVMGGIAQASNLEPGMGLTAISQTVAGTMNAPSTVNLAKTIGITIRQADGSMLPLPALIDKIWNFISSTSGGRGMDKKSLQYSMQPGYGIYNMLSGLFNNDPAMMKIVEDGLLAKATIGGNVSDMTKSQLVSANIQSATVRNMASQTAAQTSLLTSTSSAISGGYAGAADVGTGMNNLAASMSDLAAALGGGKGLLTGLGGVGNGLVGGAAKLGLGAVASSIVKKEIPSLAEGALGKILPLILAGFLAEGGPADAKQPYVVGEKGPELFVPKTDGTVISNDDMKGMFREKTANVSSHGYAGSKETLTDEQLMNTLKAAGFKGDSLNTAFKVVKRESSGRPGALNPNAKTGDYSEGLFQINMIGQLGKDRNAQYLKDYASIGYKGPNSLYDPLINAKIAYDISHKGTIWSSAWKNTSAELGIKDSGNSNTKNSSKPYTSDILQNTMSNSTPSSNTPWANLSKMSDPTAASRFAAAQAAANGGQTATSGSNTNVNYGGFTLNFNGITDTTKIVAAVQKVIQSPAKAVGKG